MISHRGTFVQRNNNLFGFLNYKKFLVHTDQSSTISAKLIEIYRIRMRVPICYNFFSSFYLRIIL